MSSSQAARLPSAVLTVKSMVTIRRWPRLACAVDAATRGIVEDEAQAAPLPFCVGRKVGFLREQFRQQRAEPRNVVEARFPNAGAFHSFPGAG